MDTEAIKDIQSRRAGNLALNRLRGVHQRKNEQPAIMNIFNKMLAKPKLVRKPLPVGRIRKVAEKYQGPLVPESQQQKTAEPQNAPVAEIKPERAEVQSSIARVHSRNDSKVEFADEKMEELNFTLERNDSSATTIADAGIRKLSIVE